MFNSVYDCNQLIAERLIDYIRTPVTHAGGITHLQQIFDLAAIHGVRSGSHGPGDISPVGIAANLHLDLTIPNFGMQEYLGHLDPAGEVFDTGYRHEDGMLHLSDRPGLGVDVDEAAAARYPYEPNICRSTGSATAACTTGEETTMSAYDELAGSLSEVPVIAILRAPDSTGFAAATKTLQDNGIRCAEFTLTSAGALDALRDTDADDMCLGAGTILTVADARAAVGAGARFLVCPHTDPAIIAAGRELGVPVLPGALTATEVLTAHRAGATMVKLFPSVLGPAYLKAIGDPLPDVPLVPTGGVTLENAADFLRAGAAAVGVGGALIGDAPATGDWDGLARRAQALVDSLS